MNYRSANQLFSAVPNHSAQLSVSGHDTAQLLQAGQPASGQERAKQMGAFTESPVSHIISQPHREKLLVAPLVLEDGSQKMPYAELWPQDVRKVNAAARYLKDIVKSHGTVKLITCFLVPSQYMHLS